MIVTLAWYRWLRTPSCLLHYHQLLLILVEGFLQHFLWLLGGRGGALIGIEQGWLHLLHLLH